MSTLSIKFSRIGVFSAVALLVTLASLTTPAILALQASNAIQSSGWITYLPEVHMSIRGIQWVRQVAYSSNQAWNSLTDLQSTIPHCNYIYLDVWVDASNDEVQPRISMESEYTTAIERAKQKGYKVILRTRHNPRPWTGYFPSDVAKWWQTYTEAVVYWAKFAGDLGVESLGIGCELFSWEVTAYNSDWENLINQVRDNYSGEVWYSTNYWYERTGTSGDSLERKLSLTWFGLLDYIGVSVYWELSIEVEPSVSELVNNWHSYVKYNENKPWLVENIVEDNLRVLSEFYDVPILIVGGLASAETACQTPWAYGSAYDNVGASWTEQENWFEALFQVFSNRTWVVGYVFDGAWWTRVPNDNPYDKHFSIQNKPAEQTVEYWFEKSIRQGE